VSPFLDDRRGVLRTAPDGTGSLERRAPTARLAPYITWYWSVSWDLRGHPPHRQVTLPHPSAHLIFELGEAMLYGPPRQRFERELSDVGRVVGVRFSGGGLAALLGGPPPVGPLPASTLDGLDGPALAAAVAAATDMSTVVGVLDAALTAILPAEVDPALEVIDRALLAVEDSGLVRVDELAERLGLGVRSLQRLFARYVGLSPGWVIRRRRLQEVALRATSGEPVDWSQLAVQLGYYDQAHLVRDFTAAVGEPPARYSAR
jgi:AraC-like DNA-binding protein